MKKPLVFVSGNLDKVRLTKRYLAYPLVHHKLDLLEIQSLNPREVVTHKAREAYRMLQAPVLVEDTSLIFHALGRLPGTYIKWFFEELGNEALCRMLDGYQDRSATASVCFGYFTGEKDVKFFEGTVKGSIALSPKGKGFGWTPIFVPQGQDKTFGEMTPTQQDAYGIRPLALAKLDAYLNKSS